MSTTEEHITVNGHWTLRKWTENEYKKYHNTMHEIHEFHVSKSWLEDSQFLKHFMTQMKNVDSRDDRRGQLTNIDQQRLQEIITGHLSSHQGLYLYNIECPGVESNYKTGVRTIAS